MFKKIILVLAVLFAVFLIAVSQQPEDFSLSRSTVINAEPAKVFVLVNDFHKWENWSPWAKIDPNMKATYEGPASGEGAAYSWSGDSQAGAGKMTITKSQPPSLVLIRLDFYQPMEATNMTEFTFAPEGKGTKVTWTMSGKNNFLAKAMHMIMNMEKMLGPVFDQGLASMKALAEKA